MQPLARPLGGTAAPAYQLATWQPPRPVLSVNRWWYSSAGQKVVAEVTSVTMGRLNRAWYSSSEARAAFS